MVKKVLVIVLWILVALQLIFIFAMSAENAAQSSGQSIQVAKIVARAITPGFDHLPGPEQNKLVEDYHNLTRKGAHVLEYAMLCAFMTLALHRLEKWRGVTVAWGLSTLYAALDEVHQLTVPGRGAAVTDVLIDAGGAALGGILALIALHVWRKIEKKKMARKV